MMRKHVKQVKCGSIYRKNAHGTFDTTAKKERKKKQLAHLTQADKKPEN